MKIARFFGCIFGLLGTAVMVFSIGLCLTHLNSNAEMKDTPAEAAACSERLMEALAAGDYAGASQVIYGQPDLGAEGKPENILSVMIWDAFQDSISYEFKGGCYATESGIARDATITAMDISSVTASLSQRAHDLLTAKVESATDMEELYDENNDFREDLVADVLQEVVVRALAEDAETVTRDVTLNLIQRDGQWWVVPDAALLQAISGGLA